MSIPKMTTDLAVIQKLSDLPNSTEGLTAQELKARFDESGLAIQKWINESLLPNLVAKNLPFAGTSELNAGDVQAAIELVHSQIRDAASGTIVNGSVTREKLAAELLERVFGGRIWISMDRPKAEDTPEKDFPVGQLWLRPGFTVSNLAGTNWTATACTAAVGENTVTITGNQTVAKAEIMQTLSGIGQGGDRVMVLFEIVDRDQEIEALHVTFNGGDAAAVTDGGVFSTTLMEGGAMTIQFAATWPSTSLASGSFTVAKLAVVNLDAIMRGNKLAAEMDDWGGWLQKLLPIGTYLSPRELFVQSASGVWQQLDHEVFPVERGGTGFHTIGTGELLVGGGDNRIEKLETAEQDESFLQFSNGRPVWRNIEETVGTLGALRMATGGYWGTGAGRTMSLPVTPKLLHISSPNGCYGSSSLTTATDWADRPCTIAQGSKDTAQYSASVDGGYTLKTHTVGLSGNAVNFSNTFCNRSGTYYNWVAIY